MRKYGLKALAIATAMSMVLSSPLQVYAKRRANTAGSWKQSGENWSFLDEKGQNVLGWIYENGSWYYVDPKTGTLRSGWLYLADGSQYFFSNKHDGSFSKMLTGWNWIDGNCYYFVTEADEREGKLIKDGTTPDGYRVDKDGKWVDASGNIQSRTGEGYITKSASAGNGGKSGGKSSSGKRGGSGGRRGGGSGGSSGGSSHTTPVKPVQPEEQSKPAQPETQPASPSNPAQPGVITPENPANPAVSPEAPEHPVGPVEDDRPGKNGDASKPENEQPEKELKSRMVHLGFADFVTVVFRRGTLADHEIYVDGVNVTEAVRKVDDAGRVVKWASTVASPKELVVVNKADGSTEQTLRLNAGTASETVTPGNPEDQPDYILSRGRVSKFDYLLAPKDKEGRDRILPATTTFDLLQERKENSDAVTTQFYVKAVEINAEGKGVQKDNIVIKFNVENEEQKKWFEGIDSLKIMNNENWPVNQNPTFTKEVKDTKHGKNGIIQIPTGQDNMRSRGIYRVNIHSSYTNETVTVPFELVSSAKFSLKQRVETANPKAGEREILLGAEMASKIARDTDKLIGQTVSVSAGEGKAMLSFTVSGIVSTGGKEEQFAFLNLDELQKIVEKPGAVGLAQLSVVADGDSLKSVEDAVRTANIGIEPQEVQQIAHSEFSVLKKLEVLILLVTIIVLILTLICVTTTMTAVVTERRREIGLKKALGASNANIVMEFLGEGCVLGLVGGLLGSGFGYLFAQSVSLNVFSRGIAFAPGIAVLAVVLSVIVTGVASLIPVRIATSVDPAIVLRGE